MLFNYSYVLYLFQYLMMFNWKRCGCPTILGVDNFNKGVEMSKLSERQGEQPYHKKKRTKLNNNKR